MSIVEVEIVKQQQNPAQNQELTNIQNQLISAIPNLIANHNLQVSKPQVDHQTFNVMNNVKLVPVQPQIVKHVQMHVQVHQHVVVMLEPMKLNGDIVKHVQHNAPNVKDMLKDAQNVLEKEYQNHIVTVQVDMRRVQTINVLNPLLIIPMILIVVVTGLMMKIQDGLTMEMDPNQLLDLEIMDYLEMVEYLTLEIGK